MKICESLFSNGKLDVAKLLQACDNEKNTPLHLAAKADNQNIFNFLLDCGRKKLEKSNSNEGKQNDIYGITTPRNRTGRTPLLECAKYNRVSFVRKLLMEDEPIESRPTEFKLIKWKTEFDQLRDEDRMTCLHLACRAGKCETC